ncbi:MAG: virulence RhuM family protein [Treponema sp.]|jgi:hypothetical protein|nr:virulence RhuM family protein [Treponema sp.]
MTLNKIFSVKISLLFMFIVLLLSGCFSDWQGDFAKIVISFSGGGRAALGLYNPADTETHSRLEHEITLTRKTETLVFNNKGTKTFEAYAAPGEWTIWVYSWLDDDIYKENMGLTTWKNSPKIRVKTAVLQAL